MGMFLNYHNIADNYMPNNLINAFPKQLTVSKLDPLDESKPFEEYDIKGNLIGYSWRQGETLNLEFNIDGEITLEDDAVVMKTSGQAPDERTMGNIGQRLYNIVDFRSWTCVGIFKGKYFWHEDEEFTYPTNQGRCVYVSAEDYLKDKTVEVILYNFRLEPICKRQFVGNPKIIFSVDKELSATLQKGIYYCSVNVFNSLVSHTIFNAQDCTLMVK